MKFSVPTNWQDDLLSVFESPSIFEVYGKLAEDFVGGGRPAYALSCISKNKIEKYVQSIHDRKREFNYLLNASCLSGREFTRRGRKEIFRLLDWLVRIGADSVTVSLPYLAEIIKENYPTLKIKVSVMAHVDSLEKSKFWESLGVSSITLLHTKLNRDFELLKQIRKNVKSELQLMANNHCLYNCPLEEYHELFASHASQSGRITGSFTFDYCYLTCRYKKLSDPTLLISAPWIRPEDVYLYEELGIDSIKIVDRRMPSAELIKIIRAYVTGKYEGNLAELFPNLSGASFVNLSNILLKIKHGFHPLKMDISTISRLKKLLGKLQVFIDNSSLDGFIHFFLTHNCRLVSCNECGYCRQIAERAVRIDKDYQDKMCREYREFLKNFSKEPSFSTKQNRSAL